MYRIKTWQGTTLHLMVFVFLTSLCNVQLLAAGSNKFGKLGINQSGESPTQFNYFRDIFNVLSVVPVHKIHLGLDHAFVSDTDFNLWAWGNNVGCELGFEKSIREVHLPTIVSYFNKNKISIRYADGGNQFSIGLQTNGSVWSWGTNYNGRLGRNTTTQCNEPGLVELSNLKKENVIQVNTQKNTAFLLTDKGNVYVWGRCSDNLCGTKKDDILIPTKLHINFPVKQMWVGMNGVFFQSEEKELYSFGLNLYGLLCHTYVLTDFPTVTKVEGIKNITKVDSGNEHTIILTAKGEVYGCGKSDFGEFGDINIHQTENPVRINAPANPSTIAVTDDGTFVRNDTGLYASGRSNHGELGYGDYGTYRYFRPIASMEKIEKINSVSAHADYAFIYASVAQKEGLSGGAIAGIVIGSIIGAIILAIGIFFLVKFIQSRPKSQKYAKGFEQENSKFQSEEQW